MDEVHTEVAELGFEGELFVPPLAPVAGAPPLVTLPAPVGAGALARDIAEQVRRAHTAVLAAHGTVQNWLLAHEHRDTRVAAPMSTQPPVTARLPERTERRVDAFSPLPATAPLAPVGVPDSPTHVDLEYTIPAAQEPGGEAGDPAAFVFDAASAALRRLAEGGLAPAGCVHHPGRYTLVWSDDLPEDGRTLRVRAAVDSVERGERGTTYAFTWRVHVGGRLVAEATGSAGFLAPAHAGGPLGAETVRSQRDVPRYPRQFRPLAATHRSRLTAQDLFGLAGGYISTVFGPAFAHEASTLRMSRQAARLLLDIDIAPEGGRFGQGRLVASVSLRHDDTASCTDPTALLTEAAFGALQAYVLQRGLHLCMPDSRFRPWGGCETDVEVLDPTALTGPLRYEIDVAELGLVPRPHAVADVLVRAGERLVARLQRIGVVVREKPGEDVTPRSAFDGGVQPCRHNAAGEPAPMNELHVAYSSEGDLSVLREGTGTLAVARPRLPRGDFLMVDRGLHTDARLGEYRRGTVMISEFDVHQEPWYCRENGSGTMPNLVYLESALQSVTAISATQGIVLEYPESDFVCRNLEGRATLLRDADPRGRTLRQHTTLLDHSPLPGAILHRYAFEVGVDAEPVYAGETVHGFFTPEVLAKQQGLDGGRCVPTWLERQGTRPGGVRRLDLSGDTRLGRGRLALLHEVDLLSAGGDHGAGYVVWERRVPDDDWFMAHHFLDDPVMPGSVGVESLFQAVGAWLLHSGLTDGLRAPVLRPAVGVELAWKYRGQILPEHQRMRGEVHLREVRREAERIIVIADGSVWRDDLRIYQVDNIAVEARPGEGGRR